MEQSLRFRLMGPMRRLTRGHLFLVGAPESVLPTAEGELPHVQVQLMLAPRPSCYDLEELEAILEEAYHELLPVAAARERFARTASGLQLGTLTFTEELSREELRAEDQELSSLKRSASLHNHAALTADRVRRTFVVMLFPDISSANAEVARQADATSAAGQAQVR